MTRAPTLTLAPLACALLAACAAPAPRTQRYAMVVDLAPGSLERYRDLHAHPWEGVLDQLDRSHVRDYSIWLAELRPGEYTLFGYLEYDGDDFEADMARMAEDGTTQLWWKETAPCQRPIATAREGEQWVMLEELFFHDRDARGAPLMPPPARFTAGRAE